MAGSRAPLIFVTVCLAALAVHVNGQRQDPSTYHIEHVGLPAVDVGVSQDLIRTPDSPETRRRLAAGAAIRNNGITTSSSQYAPGRVIVRFRDEAPMAARLSAVRDASRTGAISARAPHANFDMVRIDPGDDAEAVARALARNSDVVMYAQPSYRMHTMSKPNDPLYDMLQWNLPLINLERAWDIQPAAGSRIIVAVLDTGLAFRDATITATLPAFPSGGVLYPALGRVTIPYSAARQVVSAADPSRIVAPRDFIWDNDDPLDFVGHGTHVSGTIGQLTNDAVGTAGVAFNVKLMPVKVIDSEWDFLFRAPNEGTDEVVARGIRYAADNGAKIINMSIGRTGAPAPSVEDAINYAVGKGVFLAIAAGNEFEEGNPRSVIAEICSRVPGAVSVAAVDRAKNHAYYSTAGAYIEIAAPGGNERGFGRDGYVFQQTFDFRFTDTFLLPPSEYRAPRFDILGYIGYIGTSMATPHVAGLAAMMMQQGITAPAAIEDALERFAIDLGEKGRDDLFGYGLIDARLTLLGLGLAK